MPSSRWSVPTRASGRRSALSLLLAAAATIAAAAAGCEGGGERRAVPANPPDAGLLGPLGDASLAGWPDPRPWSPPFGVRGRRPAWGTIRYRYEGEGSPLPADAVRAAIAHAAAEWARTGVVRIVEAGTDEAPDLTISWRRGRHGDCPPFLGWDGGLAHASDPSHPGDAFIHLNADGVYTAGGEATVPPPVAGSAPDAAIVARRRLASADLRAVLLHELGHTLGLDHCAEPAAAMAELYRDSATRCTPADAAGIHSLYGGGRDAASDLFIASVDAAGLPHAVAPALRRVAPPGLVAWDAFDADGDGQDEIVVWPAVDDPARVAPLGAGLSIYHLGAGGLLERSEGPARGMPNPTLPLLVRSGVAPGRPAEIAQGGVGQEGSPLRIASFSAGGLPLLPVLAESPDAPSPPPDSLAGAHGDPSAPPAANRSGADPGNDEWWMAGGGAIGRVDSLGVDDPLGALVAEDPDPRGRRRYRFANAQGSGRVGFTALSVRIADVDGDGVRELILQGWSPAER